MISFGYGIHSTYQVLQSYLSSELFLSENLYNIPSNIHNEYFALFLERGILGLIIPISQLCFLGYIYIRGRIRDSSSMICFLALTALSISLFFSFSTIESLIMSTAFWALFLTRTIKLKSKTLYLKKIGQITVIIIPIPLASLILIGNFKLMSSDIKFLNAITSYVENPSQAYGKLEEVIKINPYFAYPRKALFRFYYQELEKYPSLMTHHDTHTGISNNDIFSQIEEIQLAYSENDYLLADKLFEKAASKAPNFPYLYTAVGMLDIQHKRCLQAKFRIEHMVKLAPPYYKWENEEEHEKREKFRLFKKGNPQFFRAKEALKHCNN